MAASINSKPGTIQSAPTILKQLVIEC